MQLIPKKTLKAWLKSFLITSMVCGLGSIVFIGFVLHFELTTQHMVLLVALAALACTLSEAMLKVWEKYRTGAFNLTKGQKGTFVFNAVLFFGALGYYWLVY